MVVGLKDTAKLAAISVISCCAVFVCTLFMNFYLDISEIKGKVTSEQGMIFYDAQVSTAKVVCFVTGGCLFITSAVMLMFYVKYYIDSHKKELGILKAMGYRSRNIAMNFQVFGISVFTGTIIGFFGAFLTMPAFYRVQNEDKILPEIKVHFHLELLIGLVILPTVIFAVLAVIYACMRLRKPVMGLLKEHDGTSLKARHHRREKDYDGPFVNDLKRNMLRTKKMLVFFIIFSSFCFSAMTQMSASMKDMSSEMMGIMMLCIGIILACTTLFLAITTVIKGNTKTIAMMRAFGYSQTECFRALLGGYRPVAYIGFAVGTVYQYMLLRMMVDIVFKDLEKMPEYTFDVPVMLISLVSFVIFYETVMYVYFEKIKKITIKEIMIE